jgi:hypothetical protein
LIRKHPVNKRQLLSMHRTGAYCVLARAIQRTPEAEDGELLSTMRRTLIPRGMAQHVVLDAAEALRDAKVLTSDGMRDLRLCFSIAVGYSRLS